MSNEIMQLCRLCLVKDQANVPIFAEQNDRQIFVKITACLPIRVSKDDSLPKKICDSCLEKLDSLYQFWNTTANAEKQLLTWLGQAVGDTEFKLIQEVLPVQVEVHSIKQEELDPLDSLPEDTHENFISCPTQMLADTHFQESIEFSEPSTEFHSVEDLGFQNRRFPKITRDYSGSAPAKRRKQVATKLVNDGNTNNEEVCRPSIATVIVKTEKESDCIDAEDMGKNSQINFTPNEIHGKEQSELFGLLKDDHEKNLKTTKFKFQVPSTGQCHICAKIFLRRGHLKRHMLAHTDERPISCDICFMRFKDKFAMGAHRKYHTDAKPFKCNTCDKTFKRKVSLEYHYRRHIKDYKITCEICKAGFYTDAEYKLHLGSKHGQSSYVCPICNKALYNKDGLNKHMLQHADDYKDAKFKCGLCGKSFLQERYLKNHIDNQHTDGLRREYVCDLCGKKLCSGTSLRAHQLLHEGIKPNKCGTCGKGFNSKSNLIVHLRTHTGDRPYRCEHCSKAFTQRNTYVIHMRNHTGERPYVCQLCDTGFVSRTTLNIHHKNKHNMLRHKTYNSPRGRYNKQSQPNRTTYEKFFKNKTIINDPATSGHNPTHSGDKQFKCNLCNYKCTEGENLKTHLLIHIGEKLFKCDLCDYRCRTFEDLEKHMFTHAGENRDKPLKCNLCDYRCSFSAYLKKHMLTHTGEKPFKCDLCDYKCNQSWSLKRHMVRHTSKNPSKRNARNKKASRSNRKS